jgi:hypothetical protein
LQRTFIHNDQTANARDHKADCPCSSAGLKVECAARHNCKMRMGNISSGVPRPDEFQFSDVREMLLRSRKTRPRLNAVAVASLQRRRYLPALCRVQALAVPAIGALTHIDDDDRHSRMRSQVGARCGHCCEVCLWHIASFRGDNNSVAFGSEPDIQRAALSEPNL